MPLNSKGKYFANPAAGRAAEQDPMAQGDGDMGMEEGGKVPADSVAYQPQPAQCDACEYFIADGEPCQKVSDPIQASGWCTLFEAGGQEANETGENELGAPDEGGPVGPPGAGAFR